MKRTDELKELRGMGADEVSKKIAEHEEELMKLRFRHASGQLDATAQLKTLRGQIARAKTVLNERSAAETQ